MSFAIGALVVVTRCDLSIVVGRVHRVAPLVVAVSGTKRRLRIGQRRHVRAVARLPRAIAALVSELQSEGRSFTANDVGIGVQSWDAPPSPRLSWRRKKKTP